jgi:TolB-like protein
MPAASPTETSGKAKSSSPRGRRRRSIDSLAVLPFVNASRDEELEYLGDGLTESLINNLSQIPKLRVMARTGRCIATRDATPIHSRLASSSASGPCRPHRPGRGRSIAVELVDVNDGSQLWGSQFARPPSDLLVVEEEIAREITDALKLNVAPAVPPAAAGGAKPHQRWTIAEGPIFLEQTFTEALQKAADF